MKIHDLFERELPDYPLENRFKHFNKVYFDGVLEDVSVSWRALKGKSGICKATVITHTATGRKTVKDGSIKITISNSYKKSHEQFDAILLHEMIHAYLFFDGDIKDSHGPRFLAMAKNLSEKTGLKIPVVDTENTEIALDNKVVIVVLEEHRNGKFVYTTVSPNKIMSMLPAIEKREIDHISLYNDVWVYKVQSALWTLKSMKTPTQRNYDYRTKRWILTDMALVDDLKKNGEVLWQLSKAIKKNLIKVKEGREYKVDTPNGFVRVYKNPTAELVKRIGNSTRGFIDRDGDLYVWDAYDATHETVEIELGIRVQESYDIIGGKFVHGDVEELRSNNNFNRAYRENK